MHDLFRTGLLNDRVVVLAGAGGELAARLEALGASVHALEPRDDEGAVGADAEAIRDGAGHIDAAVIAVAAAGPQEALDVSWIAARAVATTAMIPDAQGGALVLLAPRPGEGPHAEATRAGVENMARTLSVEWARYGIRPNAIAPGATTTPDEVAALVAYLVCPAADYFSGSRFSLGEAAPARSGS
jgi:hypothetical protein